MADFSDVTTETVSHTTHEPITEVQPKPESKTPLLLFIGYNIYWYGPLITMCLGILGNSMTFIIFSRKAFHNSLISLMFRTLAVTDMAALWADNLVDVLSVWFGVKDLFGSTPRCKAAAFFTDVTKTYTIWVMVIIIVERVIAIAFPHKAKAIITKKASVIAMAVALILTIGFFIMDIVAYEHRAIDGLGQFCVYGGNPKTRLFMQHYYPWTDFLLKSGVPFCVILVSNITICVILIIAARRRVVTAQSTRSDSTSGTTAMLLSTAVVFLLFTLPKCITYMANIVPRSPSTYLFYYASHQLEGLTFAVNFYIYLASGKQFRNEAFALLKCRKMCRKQAPDNKRHPEPVPCGNGHRIEAEPP